MDKIRTTLLTALLFIMVVSIAQSQTPRTGIKGGLNLSNLYIDDVEDENVRVGFHAGLFTQLQLGPGFAIQPEINYSTKGAAADYNFVGLQGESEFNLNYIDVPILATFQLGRDVDIHIGPYFAYLLRVGTSTDGELGTGFRELDRDDYQKWDIGISGGLAFNFNPVSLGLRYNYGLREIADSDGANVFLGDAKNSVAQIYLAFNFMRTAPTY